MVNALLCHQLLVSALLRDLSLGDNGDLVGVFDGGETMCDDQRGAAAAELVQRLLNEDLGGVVKRLYE